MILNLEGLKIACGLSWFKVSSGIYALCVCIPLAFVAAVWMDKMDEDEEIDQPFQPWQD